MQRENMFGLTASSCCTFWFVLDNNLTYLYALAQSGSFPVFSLPVELIMKQQSSPLTYRNCTAFSIPDTDFQLAYIHFLISVHWSNLAAVSGDSKGPLTLTWSPCVYFQYDNFNPPQSSSRRLRAQVKHLVLRLKQASSLEPCQE